MLVRRKHKHKHGGDIVSGADKLLKKIGFKGLPELHMRTLTGKKYNFCGPGTKLEERLDENGNPLPHSMPINKVDEICMHHDKSYQLADEGVGTRKEADKKMLDELNNLNNKELSWSEWFAKLFTKGVIGIKHKLGFGINEATELHKPIRHKFKRRRVYVFNIDDIWTADLLDKQSLAKNNKGYKYLLTIVDTFSKFAYCLPLKSKSQDEIINAFAKLFITKHPRKLWTDAGTEFTNKKFKQFLSDHNIELYHVYNEGKACIAERFNRTLGEMIAKHLTANKTKNYINELQRFIDEYNHRYHRSIKMTPYDATNPDNRVTVLHNLFGNEKFDNKKAKYKVGDRVRIYAWKNKFDKGSKPNWTTEIFIVSEVKKTNPITYKIKDLNNEDIIGSFYEQELQKTTM